MVLSIFGIQSQADEVSWLLGAVGEGKSYERPGHAEDWAVHMSLLRWDPSNGKDEVVIYFCLQCLHSITHHTA